MSDRSAPIVVRHAGEDSSVTRFGTPAQKSSGRRASRQAPCSRTKATSPRHSMVAPWAWATASSASRARTRRNDTVTSPVRPSAMTKFTPASAARRRKASAKGALWKRASIRGPRLEGCRSPREVGGSSGSAAAVDGKLAAPLVGSAPTAQSFRLAASRIPWELVAVAACPGRVAAQPVASSANAMTERSTQSGCSWSWLRATPSASTERHRRPCGVDHGLVCAVHSIYVVHADEYRWFGPAQSQPLRRKST